MNPSTALILLGAAGAVVWILTDTGGLASFLGGSPGTVGGSPGVAVNSAGRAFLSDDELNFYLSGFAVHLTNAQAAQIGASAGAPLAGMTFGISIGIGALVGWLTTRNSNDTKEDREVFAKRLGFTGANADGLGIHTQVTTSLDDKTKGLYSYLTFAGYDPLRHRAMATIGRKDFESNAQWMLDVLVALWQVNFTFPR